MILLGGQKCVCLQAYNHCKSLSLEAHIFPTGSLACGKARIFYFIGEFYASHNFCCICGKPFTISLYSMGFIEMREGWLNIEPHHQSFTMDKEKTDTYTQNKYSMVGDYLLLLRNKQEVYVLCIHVLNIEYFCRFPESFQII